jgi:hypothetical protein
MEKLMSSPMKVIIFFAGTRENAGMHAVPGASSLPDLKMLFSDENGMG